MLCFCYEIFFEVGLCQHSWLHSNENYLPCAGKYICICFLPQHRYSHAALAHCVRFFFSFQGMHWLRSLGEREREMQCEPPEVQFNISFVNWQTCLEGVHSMNQHCKQLPYGRISASEPVTSQTKRNRVCIQALHGQKKSRIWIITDMKMVLYYLWLNTVTSEKKKKMVIDWLSHLRLQNIIHNTINKRFKG